MAQSIILIQGPKTDSGSELVRVDRDTRSSGYSLQRYIIVSGVKLYYANSDDIIIIAHGRRHILIQQQKFK